MKRSLQTRYTLRIIGVIILISFLLSAIFLVFSNSYHRNVSHSATQEISQSLYHNTLQRGRQITQFLSTSLTNIFYYSDYDAIYQLLKVTGKQWGITQIIVYDNKGKIVHDGEENLPQYGQDIRSPQALATIQSPGQEIDWSLNGELNFASPIRLGDEILGGVWVSVSTIALQKSLDDMNLAMDNVYHEGANRTFILVGLATLSMVILGLFISHSLARSIIAPVRRLAKHSVEFGRGNFEHSILVDRDDEIGDLMTAFDTMRNQISASKEQLIQAKDAAEDANNAKSQFLAGISHEIRTPMNGVLGCLDLLGDAELDAQQRAYLQTAISSAQLQLTLINDILDFSKIEAKQMALDNSPFNLRDLLCDIQLLFEGSAKEKQLHLMLNADPNLPNRVLGDATRLKQILMNLVSNAIKFTSAGSVTLSGQVIAQSEQHVSIQFCVEDTGIGIAPEKQKSIFNAFIQADSSTTKKYGGTGLGLTIAMQLSKLMGGLISLTSKSGEGAKFEFTLSLPVYRQTLEYIKDEPVAEDKPIQRNYQLAILLAEDNPVNSQIAKAVLEKLGCTVDNVDNGFTAVDAIKNKTYDLIFMDCDMPKLDGFEASRMIREWEQNTARQATPIIALTAHAATEARKQCLASGMNDFLSKPYSRRQLAQVIERWHKVEETAETAQ